MFRPVPRAWIVFDVIAATVGFLLTGPPSLAFTPELSRWLPSDSLSAPIMLFVGAVTWGAVAIARLSPRLALVVAWIAAGVHMAAGFMPAPYHLAIPIVLFATSAWGTKAVLWSGGVSALVGGVIAGAYLALTVPLQVVREEGNVTYQVTIGSLIGALAVLTFVVGWGAGLLWRVIRIGRDTRAAQMRAEALAATEQERAQIARDMHDVVAHSLAVVIAQSDGARYAARTDPEATTLALTTIGQTARAALSDVRLLLTQLRHSQGEGPQPTLADLEGLYAQVRGAGVELRVTVDPTPPGEPPAAIQLAVYRILQEALTNALRHGNGSVDVRLSWQADRVDLVVVNPLGIGSSAPTGGHGVVGMRERAQLVGGTLSAERAGDRFVLSAVLPIGGPL